MVRHIRFHGRGGEGVKLASRILSRALFLSGMNVQDSPLYGAERRGAPVVAFCRFSEGPIYERGYIEKPDVVVLMDQSLLNHPEAAVLAGLDDNSLLLVNSGRSARELQAHYQITARVLPLDITSVALDLLGQNLLGAPMAGFTARATALATWQQLAEAIQIELANAGIAPDLIERNLGVTQRVYDAAPVGAFPAPRQMPEHLAREPFVVPRLSASLATPLIEAEATSALRTMEGWRVYRPVIEPERCTRCFLCFALCPEGAIQLDADNYPHIDYAHCKGCLVCLTECAPQAISQLREDAA
jgi:pyruvate ferredoxin oxidoreductase gamma subunit